MRILNPSNQFGNALVSEADLAQDVFVITKNVSGNSLLLTTEDVPVISSLFVRSVHALPSGEQLLVPTEQTDEGLLITFCDDGFVPSFTSVRIVLERVEHNSVIIDYVSPEGQLYYSTGIFIGTKKAMEHISNQDIHIDADTRNRFETLFQKYTASQGDTKPPVVCPQAISEEAVMRHFARNAMAGYDRAPGRYYTRWVPNALEDNLASTFLGSGVDTTMGYFPPNAEIPSTDVTKGQNNWWGKEWIGYWEYCNFVESNGCKFPIAIKGDADFSWDRNVGVIMPALFFNVCEEVIDGQKTERYGYTIADVPFDELLEGDRQNLAAHGITTLYRHPCATYYDPNKYGTLLGGYVERKYMIFAAFQGGYENGNMVSKKDMPQYNNISFSTYYNNVSKVGSGDGMREALVHIWEVIKYGTKHSQEKFSGLTSYSPGANAIQYTMPNAGYVVPVASTSNFNRLGSVYLTTASNGADNYPYTMTNTRREARVKTIETRTITVIGSGGETTQVSTNCLVLDENTVDEFYCCATQAEAEALQAEGKLAFAYVRGSALPLTGETWYVLDHDDGAAFSCTNSRHPYRIQGMEVLSGFWKLNAGSVLLTGYTSVQRPVITINTVYDGSTGLPVADSIEDYDPIDPSQSVLTKETITAPGTTHQWNFCYQQHQVRSTTASTTKARAYPAGVHAGLSADGNQVMQVTVDPVSGNVVITKMGTSTSQGHRDMRYYTTSSNYESLSGGRWGFGASGGSVALGGSDLLSTTSAVIGGSL